MEFVINICSIHDARSKKHQDMPQKVHRTNRSPFHVRFREYYRDYKYANNKSKFAQHVLEESHSFGPINEIMDILHTTKKGGMLDTLEKFYIFRQTQCCNQINDKFTIQSNPNFEVLIPNTIHREH